MVALLLGNAPDNLEALELVEQSEPSADVAVVEAMGETAYGDGGTRQGCADAGRNLAAQVPRRPNSKNFPKDDLVIDLMARTCTCPMGQVTRQLVPMTTRTDLTARNYRLEASGLTARYAAPARCVPSVLTPERAWAVRCDRILRKACCERRGRCSRASTTISIGNYGLWRSIDWLVWSSRASGRRVTTDGSRPSSGCIWRPRWRA